MIDQLKSFFVVNGKISKKRVALTAFGVLFAIGLLANLIGG